MKPSFCSHKNMHTRPVFVPRFTQRYLSLALAAIFSFIELSGQAADRQPEGAEVCPQPTLPSLDLSFSPPLEHIRHTIENAHAVLFGRSDDSKARTQRPLNPEDDCGPSEPLYSRLQLALTNLGHLFEPLHSNGNAMNAPQIASGSKVQGTDSRTKITATTAYPWSAICHLSVKWPDGSSASGSGFFTSQRTVMTAGHVVFNPSRGGWATQVTVAPGRNGSSFPYSKVTVGSSSLICVKGYTHSGQMREYDFAAVVLPSKTLGASTGCFGYQTMSSTDLMSRTFNIAGYPGDKPVGTMWSATGRITATLNTITNTGDVAAGRVFHSIDTFDGESGAPIWYLNGSNRFVVGVHTGGDSSENWGSRMGLDMFNFIKARP